jgi:hypothetical protein
MADVTEEGVLQRVRDELDAIKVPGAEGLEDEYNITISDDELKPVETVGDAVKLTLRLAGTAA